MPLTPTNPVITEVEPGVIAGPVRNVINPDHAAGEGSIHDDATAQRLGFRGGTVAGSYHMNLFPPLALELFGDAWYRRGTLSLYFRNATIDREPVRAYARRPARDHDVQTDAWIRREDGLLVAEGTLSQGESGEPTALGRIPLEEIDPSGCRILASLKPGDEIPPMGLIQSQGEDDHKLRSAAELLPQNIASEPYGRPVLIPNSMVGLLYAAPVASLRGRLGRAVGLFGAIELRTVNGPALMDTPYTVHGRILAVGTSPKTEFFWFETAADDADGRRVAEMRMLLRFMKASSELWKE